MNPVMSEESWDELAKKVGIGDGAIQWMKSEIPTENQFDTSPRPTRAYVEKRRKKRKNAKQARKRNR